MRLSPRTLRTISRSALVSLVCVVGLAAMAAIAAPARSKEPSAGAVGTAMPPVDLASVGEPRLDPRELDGKVVLYEFWATWCTPCHVQVEVLKEIYPEWRRKGVAFVGVDTGEPEDVVADYLAKKPSVYPVLLDPDEKLGMALEVLALPTLVVVDREGKIAWRHTGIVDAETLGRAFEAAGAGADAAAPAAVTTR